MDSLNDKRAAAVAQQEERRKDHDRLCQIAFEKFSDDAGQELLAHLVKRFDLLGRTFIPQERGDVNALRAAVRDGERAVVAHVLALCRAADKKFPIPL